jgi:hypothetical protein
MPAKVFIVSYKSDADYPVFFVDHRSDEKNAEIIKGGKLVKYKSDADVKVFIVNYKSDAKICILRENFPK